MGDESPSSGKCSANEGKTNRFAPFQIRAAFAAIGPRTPLASGMAAREGEDPRAGLQRSRPARPHRGDALALGSSCPGPSAVSLPALSEQSLTKRERHSMGKG
jgi:hypothetical protein